MYIRLLFALALLLPAPIAVPVALAQEGGLACAPIDDDAARLACYDEIFRSQVPAGETVVLESEQLIPARPTGRVHATMTVACDAGALSVSFGFGEQFLSPTGDDAPLTFQVDQSGNTVRNLPVNADNTRVGFFTTRESGAFLDTLQGATNLRVRVTPNRQRTQTVDFRLRDKLDEMDALRGTCG